jgi:hypothetical protein
MRDCGVDLHKVVESPGISGSDISGSARAKNVMRSSEVSPSVNASRASNFVDALTPVPLSSMRYQFRLTPAASAISSCVTRRPHRIGSLLLGPSRSASKGMRRRIVFRKAPSTACGWYGVAEIEFMRAFSNHLPACLEASEGLSIETAAGAIHQVSALR